MTSHGILSATLRDAITDGSFPTDDELLTSELPVDTTPPLLRSIAAARKELEEDIRTTSKDQAAEVDEWISQAKKVQDDIAKCKSEARQIVEEHGRVQTLRAAVDDAANKIGLLEAEITFTKQLERQFHAVAELSEKIRDIESDIASQKALSAAKNLPHVDDSISKISAAQTRVLFKNVALDLRQKARRQMEDALTSKIVGQKSENKVSLDITTGPENATIADLLVGLESLDVAEEATDNVRKTIEAFLIRPLSRNQAVHLSSVTVEQSRCIIDLEEAMPTAEQVLDAIERITQFLDVSLPEILRRNVFTTILPKVVAHVTSSWLDPAIPYDLGNMKQLDNIQQRALQLANFLKPFPGNAATELFEWIDQAPRTWLSQRRTGSLNAVRKVFTTASGHTRQVERVERGRMEDEPTLFADDQNDDWNSSWDDEKQVSQASQAKPKDNQITEDDTSAWGFDDDENSNGQEKSTKAVQNAEDDAADAWGWDDDIQIAERQPPTNGTAARHGSESNISHSEPNMAAEMTISEHYSITDIPDRLLEILGKDIRDAHDVEAAAPATLQNVSPASGLLSLPTLSLAMFRATAPTHYATKATLSSMLLYNDALYMAQKLKEMDMPAHMHNLNSDCKAMEKFAKAAYAKEMEVQRTILADLLDGAQGFTSCTKAPYAGEIDGAVSSTVDRIRSVHQEWKPTLSEIALLQSSGALVAMVIDKVIKDIEDMDDISEPESQRLVFFCKQITTLKDLFLSQPPGEREPRDTTAFYVSNWIHFEYLVEILGSSLVDIIYLWTEGELSLFFSREEVVDLVEALFTESTHRRNAISSIRTTRK